MKLRNTFIIFVVSGFWHGANWTFIVWGFLNALYFLPLLLSKRNRVHTDQVAQGRTFASIKEVLQICVTFFLTVIAWIFFRAMNITEAFGYLEHMFAQKFVSFPNLFPVKVFGFIALLVAVEWLQRDKKHGLEFSGSYMY